MVARVLIVDLDVHQGDGTAAIFAGDASVFTFSMHGRNNFPFRKHGSDLDVDLDDGTEDAPYLAALESPCRARSTGRSPTSRSTSPAPIPSAATGWASSR